MSNLREAAQQALEALENFARFQRMMMDGPDTSDKLLAEDYAEAAFLQGAQAIPTLRAALAEPELKQRTGDCLLTGVCASEGHRIKKAEQQEPVAQGWQTIDTAPKGRIVLVYYKNPLGNGRTMRARYYLPDTLDSDTTDVS